MVAVMRFASCLLIVVTMAILTEISLSVQITISPSCSRRASCQRLAGITLSGTHDVTLTFMPGNHQVFSNMYFRDFRYLEFKGSGINVSTITCTNDIIKMSYNTRVKVSGLTFSYCKLSFIGTTNIDVQNSLFLRYFAGSLGFFDCYNVNVDQCSFNYYRQSVSSPVVSFTSVNGFRFTRNEFLNIGSKSVSAFALSKSYGFVGDSCFNNIGTKYVIYLESGSSLYVSNSTFLNDVSASLIRLYSGADKIVMVSSAFENCRSYSGGIIQAFDSQSVAVLACRFTEIRGFIMLPSVAAATVDCNVPKFRIPMHSNLHLCERHSVGDPATCNSSRNLTYSTLPEVDISLEESEYIVDEGIGRSHRALLVCAIARDLLFPVAASLSIVNGSAIENENFIISLPKCDSLQFHRRSGIQKKCAFIRIIEDSINDENSKQFSVSLKAHRPYVISGISTATVTIMKTTTTTTTIMVPTPPLPASMVTEESPDTNSSFRIALVECGPLRRMVNYSRDGDNIENLKNAIVHSFGELTGLQASHIALLQVKSNLYREYIDVLPVHSTISNSSLVKVITYSGFLCEPKTIGAVPAQPKN